MNKLTKVSAVLFIFTVILMICLTGEINKASIKNVSKNQNEDPKIEIRKSFDRMNEMLATKDLQKVMSIYDDSDDIMVIGSDSGEVFIGKEQVQKFMKMIVSMPFVFSFEIDPLTINYDKDIAWAFTDGKMVHTSSNGKVSKVPYRITAIMVKKGNEWKWKVFSGSIPRGE